MDFLEVQKKTQKNNFASMAVEYCGERLTLTFD
jgi:hypothetical protein